MPAFRRPAPPARSARCADQTSAEYHRARCGDAGLTVGNDRGKSDPLAIGAHVAAAHIRLRAEAIRHNPAIKQAREDTLHLGMIDARSRHSIERDVRSESDERLAQPESAMIEVLGSMLVITAIVAGSFTIVPSDSSASATIQSPLPCRALEPHVDDPAVDDCRVEPGGVQHLRDQ